MKTILSAIRHAFGHRQRRRPSQRTRRQDLLRADRSRPQLTDDAERPHTGRDIPEFDKQQAIRTRIVFCLEAQANVPISVRMACFEGHTRLPDSTAPH